LECDSNAFVDLLRGVWRYVAFIHLRVGSVSATRVFDRIVEVTWTFLLKHF